MNFPSEFPLIRNITTIGLEIPKQTSCRLCIDGACLPAVIQPVLDLTYVNGERTKSRVIPFAQLQPSCVPDFDIPFRHFRDGTSLVETIDYAVAIQTEAITRLIIELVGENVLFVLSIGDEPTLIVRRPKADLNGYLLFPQPKTPLGKVLQRGKMRRRRTELAHRTLGRHGQ